MGVITVYKEESTPSSLHAKTPGHQNHCEVDVMSMLLDHWLGFAGWMKEVEG